MAEARKAGPAIDRAALEQALRSPLGSRANASWCVACGASKGISPELPRVVEQQIAQDPEILKQITSADFVRGLAEKLSTAEVNADWCVGCGAESGASPAELVSNPALLSDEQIDQLAAKILNR